MTEQIDQDWISKVKPTRKASDTKVIATKQADLNMLFHAAKLL